MKYALSIIGSVALSVSSWFGSAYFFCFLLPEGHWTSVPFGFLIFFLIVGLIIFAFMCIFDAFDLRD